MPYLSLILLAVAALLVILLIFWLKKNQNSKKTLTMDSFSGLLATTAPEMLTESFLELWRNSDQAAKKELKGRVLQQGWEAYFLTDLYSQDRKKRMKAIEILGCLGGEKSFWPLMEMLASQDAELSFSGTAALMDLEAPAQLRNLVLAFREPRKWPPARVAEVLLKKGPAVRPLLKKELTEGNEESKRLTADLLTEMELEGGEKFALSDW